MEFLWQVRFCQNWIITSKLWKLVVSRTKILPTAMNYIGQQLIITLTKAMFELPEPLRSPETQLHGIQTLLANLLHQKFDDPHGILDSWCEHVHMSLNQLSGDKKVKKLH